MDKIKPFLPLIKKRVTSYYLTVQLKYVSVYSRLLLLWKKVKKQYTGYRSLTLKKVKRFTKFISSHASFLKKLSLRTLLGVVLIIIGIAYIFIFLPSPQSEQKFDVQNEIVNEPIAASESFEEISTTPKVVKILIPRLSIDLTVTPAKIINGYWETSETTASHGSGSANPGEKNNVVIFAHAREGLFYNLKDAKVDDIIYVFTKDKWFSYKISELKTVYPQQIEVVAPTNKETLTLFTCSGFFDEKRLIVKAYPINSNH